VRLSPFEEAAIIWRALVQTLNASAAMALNCKPTSCCENYIPNVWCGLVIDAKLAEVELTFLMRFISSTPAIVVEAFRNRLNPSIGPNQSLTEMAP
jgi:hypothetical protein